MPGFIVATASKRRSGSPPPTPITVKSVGVVAETAGTTLTVPIGALVSGDYAVMVVNTTNNSTLSPGNGWTEFGTPYLEGSGYYHFLWKKASGSESAGNQNVTVSAGAIGAAAVFQGDTANSAPATVVSQSNTSAASYYATGTLSTAGVYGIFAQIYAARSNAGTYTNTGTLSATSVTGQYSTTTLVTGRYATYTSTVASGSGTIRANFSSGTSTNVVHAILIPPL